MNTYIWLGIILAVILFSVWRMRVEYHRGYTDGALMVLEDWRKHLEEEGDGKDE